MKTNAAFPVLAVVLALAASPCFAEAEPDSAETGETETKTYRTEEEYDAEYDRIKEQCADDRERMKRELRELEKGRLAELEEQYGDLDKYLDAHRDQDDDVSDEIRGLREYFSNEAEWERLKSDNGIEDPAEWLSEREERWNKLKEKYGIEEKSGIGDEGDEEDGLGKWIEEWKKEHEGSVPDDLADYLEDYSLETELRDLTEYLDGYYEDEAAGEETESESDEKEAELEQFPETAVDADAALKAAAKKFNESFDTARRGETESVMDSLIKQLGKESSWGAAADRIAGKPTPAASTGGQTASVGRSKKKGSSAGTNALLQDEETDNDRPVALSELPEHVSQYLDETTYEDLNWSFGGFDGSTAEGSQVMIGGLEMSKNGLSFEYDFDLSTWGLEETQYKGGPHGGAIACLFVLDNDGNWVGGKFDWISSSRQTRGFANIYGTGSEGAYKGWDLSNVPKSTTAAFVIVSADGKLRSNVITARWDR